MFKTPKPLYNLEISDALAAFHTTKEGLSSHEATKRQKEYGPNALPIKKQSLIKRLLEPFANVFVGVLVAALILSIIEGHLTDAIIIGIIVGINAIIFYAQQYSVDKTLKSLRDHDITHSPVIRDGATAYLPSEELTYGDVVHLAEGMKIPADGRLIASSQLECDEAMLTGESIPVHKHAAAISGDVPIYHQRNMVFKGTYVKSGSGSMLITGIGQNTQLGGITALATNADIGKPPIEKKIDSLITWLIVAISILATIALVLTLYRGIVFDEALRFALVIMVSAVPEGLPVALTIVLLLSARRMARVNALVKKMSSIETMGAITLIATDKTGTITENKLSVADKHTTHPTHATFDQVIRTSLNSQGDHASDSLDAILQQSVSHAHVPESWKKVHDFPFNQALRLSGVVWQREHDYMLFVKGAPEAVLERCLLRHKNDEATKQKLESFTQNGYRTIAFAHKTLPNAPEKLDHETLRDMGFDGFVGMSDQIRPDVAKAVSEARAAGVKVVMLTGDHVATAGFIAKQVGISSGPDDVRDSSVLQGKNFSDILDALQTTHVFGRVLPEHKYALLEATKGHEITAMTGDGVNDIPALVEADAGIAMGSSTDATKDASDIVLLDNNFHSIVAAIRVGRTAVANIRKMVVYLLGTSLGEVITMLSALILNVPLPVTAVQILWINLITDGASVIPLGLSPPEDRQMHTAPRSPRAPLLNFRQLSRVVVMGITMCVTVLVLYQHNLPKGHEYAQTLAFISLIVSQWTNALSANYEYKLWIENFIHPNKKLFIALGASIIIQSIILFSPLGAALNVAPVAMNDLLVAVTIPPLILIFAVDAHKLVFRLIGKHATND